MLRNKTPNPKNPIVKLFPRLAPVVIATKVRVQQPPQRHAAARLAKTNPQPDEHTQLRARLLRMILDNERSRRYDNRPNAS
jgi:hypothetical protein